MKHNFQHYVISSHCYLILLASLSYPLQVRADLTLATAPLATSSNIAVKPNILLLLDVSNSMALDYMPDYDFGIHGLHSSQCNQLYYNPQTTYTSAVTSTGVSYASTSFGSAKSDVFNTSDTSTVNLNVNFKLLGGTSSPYDTTGSTAYYYDYTGDQGDQTVKKYTTTGTTFYYECKGERATPRLTDSQLNAVFTKVVLSSTITATSATIEVSGSASTSVTSIMVNDSYSNNDGWIEIMSGPTAESSSSTVVASSIASKITGYGASVTGSTVTISGLADSIKKIKVTGANSSSMTIKTTLTRKASQGELQNFANWYTYYRTRLSMIKTVIGQVFSNLTNSFRVGLMEIHASSPVFPVGVYEGTQRSSFYSTLYGFNSTQGKTPLRSALSNAGRYYAFKLGGTDPIQYSCQQNFAIVATDGYWSYNSSNGFGLDGSTPVGDQDGTADRPMNDGLSTANNLADVAMYYYQTDLRSDLADNVLTSSSDNQVKQHMTTYALGLAAAGYMTYSPTYLTDTTGDFYDIKAGTTADSTHCTWRTAGKTCTWPPTSNVSNISTDYIGNADDLWHATVNGRGTYYSAEDPDSLTSSLTSIFADITGRQGSASAAATSTLNPVTGNNFAYVGSYTTVDWRGNLEAREVNTATGEVGSTAIWAAEDVLASTCATTPVAQLVGSTTIYNCETVYVAGNSCSGTVGYSGNAVSGTTQYCKVPMSTSRAGTMSLKVAANSDKRSIITANSTGNGLIDFNSEYATANPSNFSSATLAGLNQWASLTATQQSSAAGANLINYLRGQYGYEDRSTNDEGNRLYRYRPTVLGDILESQPVYNGAPVLAYPYSGYSSFATDKASRAGTVYVGANDGMLHAFNAADGNERWAYVPSMVIPNMWRLADINYATLHKNFINGSPIISDVCTANCDSDSATWKTILVAGLNGGGRGYYALDITNPDAPTLLWEFTTTSGIGKIKDDNVGYSFGQPVITRKANTDGSYTWVVLVTSGYNNTSPGDGKAYLYVLNASTGAVISKIAAGGNSSGLAKIAARNDEPAGNTTSIVYGGDLLGNLWRFDITSNTSAAIGTGSATLFANLKDAAGTAQPITTTPELGKVSGYNVVFIGTGKYLETTDLTTTQRQSQYAIKDNGSTTFTNGVRDSLVVQTLTNSAGGDTRTITSKSVDFSTGYGWYFDFPDTGERVNVDSKLVQGTLIIPSMVPSNDACTPGGYGWLNYVDYKTGSAIDTLVAKKYGATIVGVNIMYIGQQAKLQVVTSTNPTPTILNTAAGTDSGDGFFRFVNGDFSSERSLWRELTPP